MMDLFLQEILADIDWRIAEIATLKSIPVKYSFSETHKDIHYKYSVPALYALWEGFVKNTFQIYARHLNSKNIKRIEISPELLTHHLDSICDFNNPRQSFKAKKKMIQLVDKYLTEKISLPANVPTKSNVNFKILNRIFERFCITCLDSSYERGLNKLLLFRNKVAHGDSAVLVKIEIINEFIKLIEDLMLDTVINIENCSNSKTYLK